jgi:hypothetical protein
MRPDPPVAPRIDINIAPPITITPPTFVLPPPDAFVNPGVTGRRDLNRSDFENYLESRLGRKLTPEDKRSIDRGCIGVAAFACRDPNSNQYPNWPEQGGDVKCFTTESAAQASDCPKCTKKVVFAKQGSWKDGTAPGNVPGGESGQIPTDSVVPNPNGTFNYMTKFGPDYVWMDHGIKWGPQTGTVNNGPCVDPHYPRTMWCRRCVAEKK